MFRENFCIKTEKNVTPPGGSPSLPLRERAATAGELALKNLAAAPLEERAVAAAMDECAAAATAGELSPAAGGLPPHTCTLGMKVTGDGRISIRLYMLLFLWFFEHYTHAASMPRTVLGFCCGVGLQSPNTQAQET